MQVETYEIESTASDAATMAADSEAIELCKKLDLKGQLALVDSVTDTRFPYPQMTAAQMIVYNFHCPIHTRIEDYKSGIIPIRILQVVAFLKEQPLCQRIEVWHPRDPKTDPVLVAYSKEYGGDAYLCGRWGDVLLPFAKLVEKAKPLWMAQTKQLLDGFRTRIEVWERSLPQIAEEVLNAGRDFTPTLFD